MRSLLPISVIGSYPIVLESKLFPYVSDYISKKLEEYELSRLLTPTDGLIINAVLDQLLCLSFKKPDKLYGEDLDALCKEKDIYDDLGISIISSGQPFLAVYRHMADAVTSV